MTTYTSSRRERILELFTPSNELSCNEVVKILIEAKEPTDTAHGYYYLSGSVSSILRKLVATNVLEYSPNKTDRGGKIYRKSTGK